MKEYDANGSRPHNGSSFTQKWFAEEMELPIGIYQLTYDGEWQCEMAGEDCFAILNCTGGDFWQTLCDLPVRTAYSAEKTTVTALLDELAQNSGSCSFMSVRACEGGRTAYIRGSLSAARDRQGRLCVLGQLADVTGELEREIRIGVMGAELGRKYTLERLGLLQVARIAFPEIVTINLTRSTYRLVRYYGDETPELMLDGDLNRMIALRASSVHPEDKQAFLECFDPAKLMREELRGDQQLQFTYRRAGEDGAYHWIETTLMRHANPYDDDILVVVASRNVDREKEQEAYLQEKIRQYEEEMRITMRQMGNHISFYEVATRIFTTLPQTAKEFGVPAVQENYPESFIANLPAGYPRRSAEILRGMIDAIHRGEPTGSCEYPTVTADGRHILLHREFATIFDKQGNPVRAVISSEDVTEQYEHEQKQNMIRGGLVRATQLVFPEILSCNLTKGLCDAIQSSVESYQNMPLDELLSSRLPYIDEQDHDAFRRQFFRASQLRAIANGKERFQLTYRRRDPDGRWHWVETIAIRYDNPYNDDILTFIVSRNVDQQKASEERLRQTLAESVDKFEGWHYYNRLTSRTYTGLTYVHYEDGRPSPYVVGSLAERLDCPEKELALGTCFRIPRADIGLVRQAREQAKLSGEDTFQADYRIETDRGETVWVHNHARRFVDKQGETGYIHFITDITKERALVDQVRMHMEAQLRENEKIFEIVSRHSDRTLFYYDTATHRAQPWKEDDCESCNIRHICLKERSLEQFATGGHVLADSREAAARMVREIYAGVSYGTACMHISMPDGGHSWIEFKYSGLLEGESPVAALISYRDVTERHDNEMAQLRLKNSADFDSSVNLGYLEADLNADYIEKHTGPNYVNLACFEQQSYTSYCENGFLGLAEEQRPDAMALYSRDNLMRLYRQGKRNMSNVWKAQKAGVIEWIRIVVSLLEDPYSGHIKLYAKLEDITREYRESLSIRQQAELDTMTGLLRRGIGEMRIRELLSAHTMPGGILIALDLDDLKGINDTLGHKAGDAAIAHIARTLKGHFRKDDILVRAGGDEFIVFLPGAGKSVSSVELSLAALLRKLSAIYIGDNNERTLHCSIGCAVELPDTDTFDSLYQRADIALYHVKRNGKNNFAFFEPAMLEDNYRFRMRQALPVMSDMIKNEELLPLLEVISADYPGIVQFNLTRNYFRILTAGHNVTSLHLPDRVDVFWENWRENIHPDDWEDTMAVLSRDKLLALYAQGKRRLSHFYRNREEGGYIRTETDVRFFAAENGDIGAFLLFRWNAGSQKDIEIQRLNTILSLYNMQDYEYILVIDVREGSYRTFRSDGRNSHLVPESADYDTVTKYISEMQVPPGQRSAYLENAGLARVLEGMGGTGGRYSFRYGLMDGTAREAAFIWYEDTHSELLMTVRKLG